MVIERGENRCRLGLVGAVVVLMVGCRWIGSAGSSGSSGVSRKASAALFDKPRFETHEVGGLPSGYTRPVPNGLILAATEGGVALTGSTGPTAEYQLLSVPILVGADTDVLVLSVEGEVLEGSLYYALLDEHWRFLGPVTSCGVGAVQPSGEMISPIGNRSVRVAVGNGAPGIRSRWALRAIRLQQLSAAERAQRREECARKLRFDGSAWTWALRTLRQAGTTSPR